MADPIKGVGEMNRVTRSGGVVVACVWDHSGRQSPVSPLWDGARLLDPHVGDESALPGARAGSLGEIFGEAGLDDVEESELSMSVTHQSFDDWWEPFTLGVGPAGRYVQQLDPQNREELRTTVLDLIGQEPFTLHSVAWAARGLAG